MRMRQVTASMHAHGSRVSDQAEVWADIAAMSERLDARSQTGAMEEIFVRHHEFAERCVDGLRPVVRQCGALFLIDGRVVGFDLFDRAITLRRLLPKLVRSVAVDALDHARDRKPALVAKADRRRTADPDSGRDASTRVSPALLTKVAEHLLEKTRASSVHEMDAVGLGRDLRIAGPGISGAALLADGRLVHLAAFAA